MHVAEGEVLYAHDQVEVAHKRVDLAVEFDLLDVVAQRLAFLAANLIGMRNDAL